MLTKEILQEQLLHLPETFSVDQLMERLILVDKIEKGIRQSKNNESITEEDLDLEIEKWFK